MRISDWSSDVCSSDLLEPTLLTDGDVRSLSDKVRLEVDPEFDHNMETAWPMKVAARVTITLRGGQQLIGSHDPWPETSTMNYDKLADQLLAVCKARFDATRAAPAVAPRSSPQKLADVNEPASPTP